jgi:hypothetical protein
VQVVPIPRAVQKLLLLGPRDGAPVPPERLVQLTTVGAEGTDEEQVEEGTLSLPTQDQVAPEQDAGPGVEYTGAQKAHAWLGERASQLGAQIADLRRPTRYNICPHSWPTPASARARGRGCIAAL